MSPEHALAFAIFSIVAAITPGPSNTLLTATGASVGVLRGLPALAGVALGMGLMMFLVGFGLGSVILANPIVLTALKWLGAAFLLYLAWKVATAGAPSAHGEARSVGFFGAAAFQWVNPKSWLVCASAAATFLDRAAGNALGQSLAFGAIFVLVSAPSCLVWVAFGAAMQRLLRSERARRIFNYSMGGLLAASVVVFVLEG